LEPEVVRRDPHAERPERLDHLDRDRPEARLAGLGGRETRGVHRLLAAVVDHGESRVHHAPVRVEAEGGAEEEVALAREAVEEVAVVEVPVAGPGVGDRLGRLVYEIVVEGGQHGRQPFEISPSSEGFSSARSRRLRSTSTTAKSWPRAKRLVTSGRTASVSVLTAPSISASSGMVMPALPRASRASCRGGGAGRETGGRRSPCGGRWCGRSG